MPFSVDMAGIDCCAPDYYLKRVVSPISVVGFTVKGSGIIIENGKEKVAEKGSLFLVNISDSHEYYPRAEWEFYWVNINGMYWREILAQYGLAEEIVFENFELGEEFIDWICCITSDAMDLNSWQIGMQGFLYKMVLSLYKAQKWKQEETLALKIKTEFEKHTGDSCTQNEICKRIGITARHAQRIFKQEYGVSIHQFLSEIKMRQAKTLLVNTNNSIKQIAAEAGFENEKYFSTFFRKKEGVSPTRYRMKYR